MAAQHEQMHVSSGSLGFTDNLRIPSIKEKGILEWQGRSKQEVRSEKSDIQ